MRKPDTKGLRTWIEVDSKALKHNYRLFRSLIGSKVKLGIVAKSNAYGHDFLQFSQLLDKWGADFIILDSIVEALAVRKVGVKKPILVLGYTLPVRVKEALSRDISLTISTHNGLKNAVRVAKGAKRKIKIHIKVDTGLSRQGFLPQDMDKVLRYLKSNSKHLIVEGLYTHFSGAKDPNKTSGVKKQLKTFDKWVKKSGENGLHPIIHSANTGATILFPETHLDMVRVGIGAYGIWPAEETWKGAHKKLSLKPALTWKTIISEIKDLPKGSKIGYEGTETLKRKSKIAICPVGYWHGYSRRLSSTGYILVCGKRAKILGLISMDIIVIDITNIKGIVEGDEVVLLGKQGKGEISLKELSDIEGTSRYETTTCLNPLMKRIYI